MKCGFSSPLHDCLVCFLSGALNPLSAAAAAAAAAGRVALAGQAGSSGVLLVSNLNEEVSNTHTNSSQMERLRPKLCLSYHHLCPSVFSVAACGSVVIFVETFSGSFSCASH